ncbi:hypothetical protein LXL04_009126 [Taraxacum kok-saghyz]
MHTSNQEPDIMEVFSIISIESGWTNTRKRLCPFGLTKLKTFTTTLTIELRVNTRMASQQTIIRDELETNTTKIMRRYNIDPIKDLCKKVSLHALEKIIKELDRLDARQITTPNPHQPRILVGKSGPSETQHVFISKTSDFRHHTPTNA